MFESTNNQLLVTDLPDDILKTIMSYLTYDQIAKNRIVCKKFNDVCKRILNRECRLLLGYIEKYMNEVKSVLPRRESTRRAHPRYKHFQVLGKLSMDINRLIKVYSDYKENNLYCFIAGQVIDEALRLLKVLKNSATLTISYSGMVKDFRETVSMATDHFKEVVAPSLDYEVVAPSLNTTRNYATALNFNALMNSLPKIPNNTDTSKSRSRVPVSDSTTKDQSQTSRKLICRLKRNKIAILCVKGQLGKIRSRSRKQAQQLNELANRLERVEQKLNCPSIGLKEQDPLESCERIFSHIKSIYESNSAGTSNAQKHASEASTNQQSNLERKIDHLTTLLTKIVENIKF